MLELGVGIVVVLVAVIGLFMRRDVNWIRSIEEPQCTPSRKPVTDFPHTEYISKRYSWFGLKHKDKIDIDSF